MIEITEEQEMILKKQDSRLEFSEVSLHHKYCQYVRNFLAKKFPLYTGGAAYSWNPRNNLRKPPQKPTHLKNKFIRSWRAAYSCRQKIGFFFKRS